MPRAGSPRPITSSSSDPAAVAARTSPPASGLAAVAAIVVSLRPRQWSKNLFVFAGLVFGQQLFTPAAVVAALAFVIFCGLSGAIYLFNDVADRERDQRHPKKRERPVAAGRLSPGAALAVGVVLIVAGLAGSIAINPGFALAALFYVVLLTAYSAWLKHIVIVDVLVVAIGFTLRAVAGALAIAVEISGWLLICTVLIALFLALGKRRHEYIALGVGGDGVRAVHHVAGDGGEVPHAPAAGDAAVRALRDLPLPVSAVSPPPRRQPVGAVPERPRADGERRALGRVGPRHHLRGLI